jgi:hypothetical protein
MSVALRPTCTSRRSQSSTHSYLISPLLCRCAASPSRAGMVAVRRLEMVLTGRGNHGWSSATQVSVTAAGADADVLGLQLDWGVGA